MEDTKEWLNLIRTINTKGKPVSMANGNGSNTLRISAGQSFMFLDTGASAGSHTWKYQMKVISGTSENGLSNGRVVCIEWGG